MTSKVRATVRLAGSEDVCSASPARHAGSAVSTRLKAVPSRFVLISRSRSEQAFELQSEMIAVTGQESAVLPCSISLEQSSRAGSLSGRDACHLAETRGADTQHPAKYTCPDDGPTRSDRGHGWNDCAPTLSWREHGFAEDHVANFPTAFNAGRCHDCDDYAQWRCVLSQ